ncbi:unnamed protein product [Phaedon cochleariae]|uniref:Uncharacterized protein n=1 Tax=Phaedon cochleariae TaxID=80249 RepID=A0A9N9S8P7_PHACE|nr:unnamed protein product [Phaedon cochleariae]
MGSSTASENTINTSTDSSNTIVTTVTATDGEATEDSLDFPELDIFASENILDNSKMPNAILEPIPVSPKTPATAKQRTPPTGKRTDTKFTFEVHNSKNSMPMEELTPKRDDRFIYDNDTYSQKSTVDSLMEEQIEALKLEARRRNSYRQAAQNLDVIEVMSEDRNGCQMSPKEHRRSFKKKLEVGAHLEASCPSPINVTTNPLLDQVQPGGSRKAPQATIVVQQPSLSVDHAPVATVLLKNGADFVSNVQQESKNKSKLKEENMKQLLDRRIGAGRHRPAEDGADIVSNVQQETSSCKNKRKVKEENMEQLLDGIV